MTLRNSSSGVTCVPSEGWEQANVINKQANCLRSSLLSDVTLASPWRQSCQWATDPGSSTSSLHVSNLLIDAVFLHKTQSLTSLLTSVFSSFLLPSGFQCWKAKPQKGKLFHYNLWCLLLNDRSGAGVLIPWRMRIKQPSLKWLTYFLYNVAGDSIIYIIWNKILFYKSLLLQEDCIVYIQWIRKGRENKKIYPSSCLFHVPQNSLPNEINSYKIPSLPLK